MEASKQPYTKSLGSRGVVQGSTLVSKTNIVLCHFFGGLRYALPPAERWQRALKLPPSYTYGTMESPGLHNGDANVCPQPEFPGLSVDSGWSEDCFQCNVWIPVGEAPAEGWPVLVFIHGGFLQFGSPNTFSVASLLGETVFKAIVVMPAYRINVFGFLYSAELEEDAQTAGETVGNHGFWDQRLALEWTRDNIHMFGGNAANITLAGYSAGSYSVFHQLAYELRLPTEPFIIKRACMWSNGPGVQPKSPENAQIQFDQLLTALNISLDLTKSGKLARLRSTPANVLVSAASSIDMHQFRPTTDSSFIPYSMMQTLDDGRFAKTLRERGVRILLGECCDERSLYATWHPPTSNTVGALRERLVADYPRPLVDALLPLYQQRTWDNYNSDAFGNIYADMQVYALGRGLVASLAQAGAENLLYRYRIEYRLDCTEDTVPKEWGVTHTTDMALWFWGNGGVVREHEKNMARKAIVEPFSRFVNGEREIGWGTRHCKEMMRLRPDKKVEVWEDALWDEGLTIWNALRKADKLNGPK